MSRDPTWFGEGEAESVPFGLADWSRAVLRGVAIALTTLGGLLVLLALRLIERPFHGPRRPWTPRIATAVCRASLWLLDVRRKETGQRMETPGAIVGSKQSRSKVI